MVDRAKLLLASLAVLAVAGSAVAQVPEVRQATGTTPTVVRRASMIMNANVAVQGGATVGKIIDFVISDNGYVEYVVVENGSNYVLMPYQALRVEADRRVWINITRERFGEIPTFTGSNWPLADQRYLGRVRTVFGITESGYRGDRERQPTNHPDGRSDQPGAPPVERGVDIHKPPAPVVPTPPVPTTKPPEPNRNPVTPLPPPNRNPPPA
jgi:PRC-barrel domain